MIPDKFIPIPLDQLPEGIDTTAPVLPVPVSEQDAPDIPVHAFYTDEKRQTIVLLFGNLDLEDSPQARIFYDFNGERWERFRQERAERQRPFSPGRRPGFPRPTFGTSSE